MALVVMGLDVCSGCGVGSLGGSVVVFLDFAGVLVFWVGVVVFSFFLLGGEVICSSCVVEWPEVWLWV